MKKGCFMFLSFENAWMLKVELSKILQKEILIENYLEYYVIFVNSKEYKDTIILGTEILLQNEISDVWWLDSFQNKISLDSVPIVYAEISDLLKERNEEADWNKFAKWCIKRYCKRYAKITGKEVFYAKNSLSDGVQFYIKREAGLDQEYGELIKKMKTYLSKHEKNIFIRLVLCNFWGEHVSELKNKSKNYKM